MRQTLNSMHVSPTHEKKRQENHFVENFKKFQALCCDFGSDFEWYEIVANGDLSRKTFCENLEATSQQRKCFPEGCILEVQENGWTGQRALNVWTKEVLQKVLKSPEQASCLLMDECYVHLKSDCIKEIINFGTQVDFIPRGLTWRLQMIDVGVIVFSRKK